MKKTKYALVLAGGGTKGAYQIGVWKALKELHIKIGAIIGNSVGALNGALIIQNSLTQAIDLWKNISINKIVSIPDTLIKDGDLHIEGKNIVYLRDLQKKFLKNKGLDTEPLKKLIRKYINEGVIRKSGLDFGIVTYELNNFKPHEIFLDEIEKGLLIDYLLASTSIPFVFKSTEIKGKRFIDGGVYDNIPFSMAKTRGYKNIIVVDISGLGINRRPDIAGTNVIYIKNSIEMGHLLDFTPKFINEFMNLGYLDALKIFGKMIGIDYFYNEDRRIIMALEKMLFDASIILKYSKYFKGKNKSSNINEIKASIREILPAKFKYYSNLIIPLAECAALSLNIKRNKLYNFKDFISEIWSKYCEIEKKVSSFQEEKYNNFFEALSQKLKKIDIAGEIKDIFNKSSYEYEKAFELIFGGEEPDLHAKTLSSFFPNLLGAKIFFIVLKKYFSR